MIRVAYFARIHRAIGWRSFDCRSHGTKIVAGTAAGLRRRRSIDFVGWWWFICITKHRIETNYCLRPTLFTRDGRTRFSYPEVSIASWPIRPPSERSRLAWCVDLLLSLNGCPHHCNSSRRYKIDEQGNNLEEKRSDYALIFIRIRETKRTRSVHRCSHTSCPLLDEFDDDRECFRKISLSAVDRCV